MILDFLLERVRQNPDNPQSTYLKLVGTGRLPTKQDEDLVKVVVKSGINRVSLYYEFKGFFSNLLETEKELDGLMRQYEIENYDIVDIQIAAKPSENEAPIERWDDYHY